jgi:drug/metabolite transporter (DMT)-like permease
MPAPLGEIAALATSLCWTASATFFTLASRRVGSMVVNRARLVVAALFLVTTHWLVLGQPVPIDAGALRWFWLGLSGVIGLAIGDAFLFQAYIWIGPRLTMLLMGTVPVISGVLAWVTLGERLRGVQWLGVLLTVAGITWVVRERGNGSDPAHRNDLRGILFGLGAAVAQAIGLVLAKRGLGGDFPALSGNVIRMLAAAGALWMLTFLQGQARPTVQRLTRERTAMLPIVGGSFMGPFLGVWLSLISIQLTQIGVASTLMALPPVFLLPVARFYFHESVGWRAVAGTLVALAGVALLFLV